MWGYLAAALLVSVGIFASLMATEPAAPADVVDKTRDPISRDLLITAFGAFREFLTRPDTRSSSCCSSCSTSSATPLPAC